MMFPPNDKSKPAPGGADKKQPGKGGPAAPAGPGLQHMMHHGPKPGQGMNPMEAMMGGLGDISQFAPPPPPPQAPLGPDGLPVGGGMPSADPGMDPNMEGSSLFQALNMGLDPASAPAGQGMMGGQPPSLDSLLAMLAMQQAGIGPSGVMPDPTHPGQAEGLQNFSAIQ